MKLSDFGFTNGINEIIAITENEDGSWNAAPIGIIVDDSNSLTAKTRLYRNRTRANLERTGVLFANVIHDAVVFAISSFGSPEKHHYLSLNPPILKDAMAWCEFKAEMRGSTALLTLVRGGVLETKLRAVNRGFNAVIEALVHATRYVAIKDERKRHELLQKIHYYREIAEKCGSEREKEAFKIIMEKIG